MSLEQLQRLVLSLSNSCWCRYWVHRNYPQNPTKMAIQCLQFHGSGFEPVAVRDLEKAGFQVEDDNVFGYHWVYTIERTNDDGTPWESKLA